MMERPSRQDRGAAAVEFALVLPVLLLLIVGILEFGFYFFLENGASNAVRQGARDKAITQTSSSATTATRNALPGVPSNMANSATVTVQTCTAAGTCTAATTTTCPVGSRARVSVRYSYSGLTGLIPSGFLGIGTQLVVKATAEMKCGG